MTSLPIRRCLFCLFVGALLTPAANSLAAAPPPFPPAQAEAIKRWQDMRFGMFIHWGPVSLTGEEIGWSRAVQTPIEVYDNLYRRFNPTKFDADQWVSVAKAAGMKYIVLTTKHHDGFCLWDTKQTDYNIMHSPLARDVVRELADACKRQGIGFGTYYSVTDWHHPAHPLGSPGGQTKKPHPDLEAYSRYLQNQLRELLTGYGPLTTVWFDFPQSFDAHRGADVIAMVRALQADILINDRSGAAGDYDTPEQVIGGYQVQRPWETCMTIGTQWAWKPNDQMKSLKDCLQTLVRCAGGDGNLLFNVGPMPSGEIEPRQAERLKEMGAWMAKYGQSIYGTRGGPWRPGKGYVCTQRGATIYLHVLAWDGDAVKLPPLPDKVAKADLLTGGKVHLRQGGEGIVVAVSAADQKEIDTIVRLELRGQRGH